MITHTIKIIKAEKITVQEDNTQLISVLFQIIEDLGDGSAPIVEETLRHGFPVGTPIEDIQAELQRVIETYESDDIVAKKTKQLEIDNEVADATIAGLEGLTITKEPTI